MLDPALLDLFRAEIDTHLPALSEGLLALEKDPNQPKRLEALMRAAHSIKGAARIVGVEPAVQVAHAMEDCFVAAQKGAIALTSDAVDVLLGGVDALHRIVPTDGGADDGLTEDSLRRLLDDIAALRAGRLPVAPPAPSPVVPADPPTIRPRGDLDGAEAETFGGRLAEALAAGAPSFAWISLPSATSGRTAWRCSPAPPGPPPGASRRPPSRSSTPPPPCAPCCA